MKQSKGEGMKKFAGISVSGISFKCAIKWWHYETEMLMYLRLHDSIDFGSKLLSSKSPPHMQG